MGNEEIKKYDKNDNLIYEKISDDLEIWYKYDEDSNRIYTKGSDGFECWGGYDENNNRINYKDSDGYEYWYKYDKNQPNKQIIITEKEFKEIEFRKKEREYLSRTKCSRFELMDI